MYLGAMFAVRGFLDALTSELYHDKVKITLTAVDLPAVKTPQFDRARKRMGGRGPAGATGFPAGIGGARDLRNLRRLSPRLGVVATAQDSPSDTAHAETYVKDSAITTKIKTRLAAEHITA
jgi:hypothetical protein